MSRFPALTLLLTSLACASSTTISGPVVYSQSEAADSVKVRVGQVIVVEDVRVRLDAVENDSRCPVDVVCVWTGDATARLTVEPNCECRVAPASLSLHTALEPKSGEAFGYRVTLLHVLPEPRSTTIIQPASYSAWIRLTKLAG